MRCKVQGIYGFGCETNIESGRFLKHVVLPLAVQSCLGVFVVRWLVQRDHDGGHSNRLCCRVECAECDRTRPVGPLSHVVRVARRVTLPLALTMAKDARMEIQKEVRTPMTI